MLDDATISAIRERQRARVHLPVLQTVDPSAVSAPTDLFRCTKLAGVLSAGSCVKRQKAAVPRRKPRRRLNRYEIAARAEVYQLVGCLRCPVGKVVAGRLGVTIPEVERW